MITIIIPTYRPQEYLYDCLTSIKNQNIDFSLFEVLIVLNGEKEPYYNLIMGYIKVLDVSNFYVHYVESKGVSAARNYALDLSKGEYVVFIDDDDKISSNYLFGLFRKIDDNTIVLSDERTFYEKSNIEEKGYLSKIFDELSVSKNKNISLLDARSFFSTACFKMIPMNIIGCRRFNTKVSNGEDALFMASISDKVKLICLADNSDIIYYRRVRDGSASQKKRSFFLKLRNSFNLFFIYLKTYLLSPSRYNLLFFINRFLAVFKVLFVKEF